ncbi:MAG: FKBP-type peptidyl-prolyl cis-trans isomerase [Bacteroidetes bacterium]|nr:FKBP-type peptidyl-prolyl cis-trans isomerase [Bacteroidota bacterium]
MRRITTCFFSAVLISVFGFSCNEGEKFDIHESGLQYRLADVSLSGICPNEGDLLVLDMKYCTSGDSLLFSTKEVDREFKMQMKKTSHKGGSIEDAFGLMQQGDSIIALIDAGMFYTYTRNLPVPQFIKPGEKLRFEIRLVNILDPDEYYESVRGVKVQSEEAEMRILKDYLKLSNIITEPTSSGLYFVPQQEGKGPTPETGDRLSVHYLGYFTSGKPFGSSYETGRPFEFVYTPDALIEGWIEGLSYMHEGGKAILIIPSRLAYGKEGKEQSIPPYSTLVFEIDLIKVEKR